MFSRLPPKRKREPMGVREQRALEIPQHRVFVRKHVCSIVACDRTPIDAAHFDGPVPYEDRGGMKVKDHDRWVFPLCRWHHTRSPESYHNLGWQRFDAVHGIDSRAISIGLWQISPAAKRFEAKQRERER